MPVRCRKVLVQHSMHIWATTATSPKPLLGRSYPPPYTSLPMAWQRWVWRLHVLRFHLLLRQMHWLAELHACTFHQLQGSFKHWPSSCQQTVQIPLASPCWSLLLKPSARDAASWFFLANLECNAGWMGIAATPLGTKDFTPIFAGSDFALFWEPNTASESSQRSRGGSSLLTQAWERSTDTWAPSQLVRI